MPMGTAPVALLLESVHPAADAALLAAGFAVERVKGALAGAELRSALARATVVGIRSKTEIRADALAGAPVSIPLAAIGCFCIGTNQVDLRAAARRGVAVFNAPFSNTRSVAELTLIAKQVGEETSQHTAVYAVVTLLYFVTAFSVYLLASGITGA